MVQLTTLFAILALSSPAFSYPINRRQQENDDGLLQNGLEAQKLNAAFQTLKGSDKCSNGDIACVEGALALCRGDSWVTQNCPATLQCFALPDVDRLGVTIGCTSNKTAEALIEATGAQGGIDAAGLNSTSINGNGAAVATVTVTVSVDAAGQTQTLSSTTTTLTPDQASGVVSDADPGTTIALSGAAAPTPAPVNPLVQGGAANPAAPPAAPPAATGTTILLNGAAAETPAASSSAAPPPPVNGVANAAPTDATTIILNGNAGAPTPAAPTPAAAAAAPSAAAPGDSLSGYY